MMPMGGGENIKKCLRKTMVEERGGRSGGAEFARGEKWGQDELTRAG